MSAPPLGGSIVFLYTSRFKESRRFYEEDLALSLLSDKGDVLFFALPGGHGSLGIVRQGISAAATPPVEAREAGSDTVMLCLLTNDVEAWHSRLVQMGHPSEQPPMENKAFGISNALLRDPGGYLIELQQFLDEEEHERMLLVRQHPTAHHDLPSTSRPVTGRALARDLCALVCLIASLAVIVASGRTAISFNGYAHGLDERL